MQGDSHNKAKNIKVSKDDNKKDTIDIKKTWLDKLINFFKEYYIFLISGIIILIIGIIVLLKKKTNGKKKLIKKNNFKIEVQSNEKK